MYSSALTFNEDVPREPILIYSLSTVGGMRARSNSRHVPSSAEPQHPEHEKQRDRQSARQQ